jgi:hypothetical protein
VLATVPVRGLGDDGGRNDFDSLEEFYEIHDVG